MVREVLAGKVTFESRPEVGESKPCEYGGRGITGVRVLGLLE